MDVVDHARTTKDLHREARRRSNKRDHFQGNYNVSQSRDGSFSGRGQSAYKLSRLVDLFRPHFRLQAVEAREDQIVFHLDLRVIKVALIATRLGTMLEIVLGIRH